MGVIKNSSYVLPVKLSLSEESINSLGFISEPPTPPPETEDFQIINQRPRNPELLRQRLEQNPKKRTGARKTRRFDDARMLQTLAEEDECTFKEPTIEDFRPNSKTPFTQLMTDFSSMRIWQFFASQSEEDQKEYLDSLTCNQQMEEKKGISFAQILENSLLESSIQCEKEDGCLKHSVLPYDKRSIHPSFSAERRFSKVDSSLRSVLKRRHLPMGMLSCLENDVVSVFGEDVNAIYISQGISSFERLLLHGICQYNLLKSRSIDVAGCRRTKVQNIYGIFLTPKVSLTQYLEKRRKS